MNLTRQQIISTDLDDFLLVAWRHSLRFESHQITVWDDFERCVRMLNLEHGAYAGVVDVVEALGPVFARLSGVVIAREYSECLYGYIPMWDQTTAGQGTAEHPRTTTGRPLDEAEQRDIATLFCNLMDAAGADEVDILGHRDSAKSYPVEWNWKTDGLPDRVTPYRVRAWWD